jgi:hypothetical protein
MEDQKKWNLTLNLIELSLSIFSYQFFSVISYQLSVISYLNSYPRILFIQKSYPRIFILTNYFLKTCLKLTNRYSFFDN